MARGGYLPDWQRALMAMSAAVVLAVIVMALYWARTIFMPVALAIFMTFVLSPVVAWFQRRRFGRGPAVVTTVGLAVLLAGGLGVVIAQQVAGLSDTLTQDKERAALKARLEDAKRAVVGDGESKFGKLVDEVTGVFVPKAPPKPAGQEVVVTTPSPGWMAQVEEYATPALELVGQGAFAFLLTVFMLLKREDLRNRMIRLTGSGKVTTTTKAVDDASRRVSRFLLTQLLLNTAFAVVILVGLLVIGVQYAPLWAVIAFVMRYVPYIGTWIGVIPPAVFTLAVSETWGPALAVVGLFIGLELVCNNVFEPMLYGPSMGLSEVAQLVAAGLWAFLWGPIGLVLSGPLTTCLLVLGKYVSRFEYLDVLLGDEPVLEPKVAFYQRLAARDQDEAAEIALAEAGKADAVATFDRVVVPALCLAKRDVADGDLSAEDLKFAVRAAREVAELVLGAAPKGAAEAAPGDRVPVLLVPARDEVDHAGVDLLAHLLDPARWQVEIAPDEMLASELLTRIETARPAAVVIGSLPPGGMAHTRYLATRVRARFPELKIVVGRWGRDAEFADDGEKAGAPGGADAVETTLAETVQRLGGWYGVFTAAPAALAAPAAASGKPRAVGTPGAVMV
ncbi:MAG: AI-2E family transporter [Gemmataceae bacterium]|nr:AI-2E family transporter [Gemmataceae bacterium]